MHSYIAVRIVSLVACPGRKRLAIHGITCSRVVIATLHKHGLASCRGGTDAKHFTSSIVIRPRRWTSTLDARCVYDGKMQGLRAVSLESFNCFNFLNIQTFQLYICIIYLYRKYYQLNKKSSGLLLVLIISISYL